MQAASTAAGAVTNESLVAAPAAGNQITVYSVYISTDTAQTIILESGTASLRWAQYCAANGGQVSAAFPDGDIGHLFTCAEAAALTWTTTAGNAFVSVQYEVRPVFDETS